MPTLDEHHRRRLREITHQHGAEAVRLFGSFARGQQSSTSDIDLLVRLGAGRGLLDLVAIKQDVEEALGLAVDVVTEDSLSPYIREAVLREATPL
jgi:predicted nucleotidyltransferase